MFSDRFFDENLKDFYSARDAIIASEAYILSESSYKNLLGYEL